MDMVWDRSLCLVTRSHIRDVSVCFSFWRVRNGMQFLWTLHLELIFGFDFLTLHSEPRLINHCILTIVVLLIVIQYYSRVNFIIVLSIHRILLRNYSIPKR